MTDRVTPMIHVPDIQATIDWYQRAGFVVNQTFDDGDGLSFAMVSYGATQVMFNEGGKPSTERRREVDLYIHATGVDDIFARLKDEVDVVEEPHDTFYGMHEVIIRDLNGFWLTFAEPMPREE